MALMSASISEVKRSAGQCAVAAAAYGARTKLNWYPKDNKINIKGESSWDYSHLPGLAYSKIHAPIGAPSWVLDREQLWNRAEEAENRCDAQTARKFIIALQVELTLEQNIALTEDIVSELVNMGMVVDTNIHTDKPHNPHAHLLATTRELKEDRYGEMEFSKLKTREWGSKDFIRNYRAMIADKINDHLKLAGLDVRVTHESYKTLGIDLEPTRHEGPARNIKNAELVALNQEILERNAQKIRENPSLILDKLAINKPVFTKEEIAIEIEKMLSHEVLSYEMLSHEVLSHELIKTVETITAGSKKDSPDLESLNSEMTSKYMEIYTKIMSSPELSLVIDKDLKGRTLYTTTKRLEMEQRYIANVESLNNSNAHRLSLTESDLDQLSLKESITDATLKAVTRFAEVLENKTGIKFSLPEQNRELSREQRLAVLNILNGPDIGVIEGIPGAGKTVAMQEIVRQSQKAGKTVIGVAPSSAAALVLGKETGIECKNASLWRKEWLKAKNEKFDLILKGDYYKEDKYKDEEGGRKGIINILSGVFAPKGLTKDHVIIIDEASMMELSNMDYLVSEAIKAGAKVIKVCDNNQLHAVGWLGAAKKTVDICGASRLEEARRQQNPLHREATKLLGAYKVRDALKIYLNEGSIIIDKSEVQARGHLLKDYLDSYIEKSKLSGRDDIASIRTQVISTYTNAAAAKLNVEVRRSLRDAGIIKGKQYKINVGDKTINLAKGEQIVFTRNYNYLGRGGIYNGEVGTVLSVSKPDRYGHSLVAVMVSKADGSKEGVIIDTKKQLKYGLARLFDYGYAVTAHKLQGAGVDLNFLYLEENMGYEAFNVLLTRHREFFKMYVNQEILKKVIYESLDQNIEKAQLRYNVIGGEQILNGLVKLASKRVNSSFAGDYVGMGLSDNDKHLATYMETVHKAVELIREIGSWQSQEFRRTGLKPDLWEHELWEEFQNIQKERNAYALHITKNYSAFKDRIVQHSMNYGTIEKHASSKEIDYGLVEEHKSILNLSQSYKMLVESINELDVRGSSRVYRIIKSEIAANYEKVENAISERDELLEREEELKSEIGIESYYRNVLFSEYLSRIYKGSPADIIEKYNSLSEKYGAAKASAMAGSRAQMLGSLKGIGIGQLLGLSKTRKDAVANSHTLEKSLLAYSRSNEIEQGYKMQLEQHNYGLQIQKLDEEIEALRAQLPCSIDEKFLDEVGSCIASSNSLKNNIKNKALQQLKSSTLFEAIKVGIYREDVLLDRKILDREDESNNTARAEETDKIDKTTDKPTTYKHNTSLKYKKQDLPSLKYEDVRGALNPTIIESIFREYALKLNPDGQIKKQGTQISCGSLNINLSKGLWYRFSDGSKGDIFALVSEATGGSKRDALEIVAGFAGVQSTTISSIHAKSDQTRNLRMQPGDIIEGTTTIKEEEEKSEEKHLDAKPLDAWIAYDTVPLNASPFNPKQDLSFMIERGLDVTNIYEYKNIEGNLAGFTVRVIDRVTRQKQVLPVAYCMNAAKQESRWQLKGFLTSGYKPIYKVESLREKPTERVLIVEGEKAAEKAAILFPEYAVISWMGGVGSVGKVNWSELKGREVVVWPDNDQPGKIAANKIIEEIDKVNGFSGLANKIDTAFLELEAKWDLGDELPAHLPQEVVQKIIRATFTAPDKTSQLLGEGIANNKTQEKALDALDMLIVTGRIDREDVPSKAIYKSTLAAIVVSKGIDLEKSETFVDDVRGLQDVYQNMKNNYEKNISLQQTSLAQTSISLDKPADRKAILASELVRDASILHQVILNVLELPKTHAELISDAAKMSVSNITRFNDIDKEQAGSKMYQEITSTKFADSLDKKNQELVAVAKINNENKKLADIASSIAGFRAHLEKLEKLGFGINKEALEKELQEISHANHGEYISSSISSGVAAYLSHSIHKTNALKDAKNNAHTISDVINVMISQQKYKIEVYKDYRELSLEAHKASTKGSKTTKDVVKLDITDKQDQSTQHKLKDYIHGLERAYKDDREITKALACLGISASKIDKAGLLSKKEILNEIRKTKTIHDVDKVVSHFGKRVELKDINGTLDGFKRDLNRTKTLGDVSYTMKVLAAQQKYLAGLYDRLSPGHDPHLINKVEEAHKSAAENIIDKLQNSIIYAQHHNILPDTVINKKLHNAPSIMSVESEISRECINFSGRTIKEHLHLIESGKIMKFEGHKFSEPKEYLQYWKQTREHHLIPIHEINKSLAQIRHMEKAHEMGGPSL